MRERVLVLECICVSLKDNRKFSGLSPITLKKSYPLNKTISVAFVILLNANIVSRLFDD